MADKDMDEKDKKEISTPAAESSAPPAAKSPAAKLPAVKPPAAGGAAKKSAPASETPPAARLVVSSSPHFQTDESVPKIMYAVVAALMPTVLASVYFYGTAALLLIIVCTVTSVLTEYVFQRIRGVDTTASDGSVVITGLLLALTLPPSFPLTGAALGSIFAVAIGKQLFGGLGFNIFNPALLGRAFLQATYPVLITTWTEPIVSRVASGAVDAVSAATALAEGVETAHLDLFFGNVPGSLGESSAIIILIGGLFLRSMGYINWKLPLGYLGSMAFFGWIFWMIDPQAYPDPLYHILAGGAMLGAWFMVTDPVTSPTTPMGQWIFAVSAGFLAVIIRLFGGLPEGVMYSILLMNATVPLLNRWTRPRVFGEGEGEGEGED